MGPKVKYDDKKHINQRNRMSLRRKNGKKNVEEVKTDA